MIDWKAPCMLLNEYQRRAARTINTKIGTTGNALHALYGLCSEVGELQGIYQKLYQGHNFDEAHVKKELGDILWMLAEYCTSHGWTLGEIAEMNISKLEARYPNGFEVERSLHRKEGDV